MFDFTGVKLEKLVIHKCGNKFRNEGIIPSKCLSQIINNTTQDLLLKYFLSSFNCNCFYKFYHESEIQLNEVYTFTDRIFKNPNSLYEQSMNILYHLYEVTTHPNIKSGELYVAYLSNCIIDNSPVDAIGLFKSENKDTYLKIKQNNNAFEVDYDKGININKLDKGCLIFNTAYTNEYKISIVDTTNSNEAVYWKNNFLNIIPINDNHFNTKTYLNLCKDFSKITYKDEETKKDKIQFLNNTINYFNDHDEFNIETFTSSVIKDPKHIDEFTSYAKSYNEKIGVNLNTNFIISESAVKDSKKIFNRTIKLDTKVEIKIVQTDIDQSNYVEKGFDSQKGLYFYKIYFHNEK